MFKLPDGLKKKMEESKIKENSTPFTHQVTLVYKVSNPDNLSDAGLQAKEVKFADYMVGKHRDLKVVLEKINADYK